MIVASSQPSVSMCQGAGDGMSAGGDGGDRLPGMVERTEQRAMTQGPRGIAFTCYLEEHAALGLWSQAQGQGKINVQKYFFRWKHIDHGHYIMVGCWC